MARKEGQKEGTSGLRGGVKSIVLTEEERENDLIGRKIEGDKNKGRAFMMGMDR